MRRIVGSVILLLLGLVACSSAPSDAPRGARASLEQGEPTSAREAEAPPAPAPLEVVLDVRADGARLLGRVLPAPPDSDADRVLEGSLEGAPIEGVEPLLSRVIDARFFGDGVLVLDARHVLSLVRDREARELDRGVEAPLAVRGATLVYARGEMPFFELARIEGVGAPHTLTEGYAPAYSPAIGEDGSVVFVSTRAGRPRLYRASLGGRIEPLAETARTPSSPRAPSLERGLLTFEDERGEVTIALDPPQRAEAGERR